MQNSFVCMMPGDDCLDLRFGSVDINDFNIGDIKASDTVVVARTSRRCGRGCRETHASPQPLKTFKNQYRKRRRKGTSILPNWATLEAPFRETHLGVPPMMPPVWTSTSCSRQERRTGGLRVARCATLRNPSGRPTSAADRTQPTGRPPDRRPRKGDRVCVNATTHVSQPTHAGLFQVF